MNDLFAYMVLGAILLTLWNVFIRRLFLDMYRQRLFELRENLFDYADSGKTSFKSEQYKILRDRLTNVMKFSGRIGFFKSKIDRILISFISRNDTPSEKHSRFEYLAKIADSNEREKYLSIEQSVDNATGYYMLWSNPIIAPLAFIYVVVSLIYLILRMLVKHTVRFSFSEKIESGVGSKVPVSWVRSVVDNADHDISNFKPA